MISQTELNNNWNNYYVIYKKNIVKIKIYKLNPFSAGIVFKPQNQILTHKDDPRTERI